MSQENVEALSPIYDEWRRGNWTPAFDIYDPNMEWGWSEEFPDLGGVYHDPELKNKRLQRWLSSWETWRCEAEEYRVNGDFVVVLCRYIGRGKGSGLDIESQGAHVWKLRGGKVVRLEVFSSRKKALESAGLSE
jgi:ketosteroid isomerase-like protein